MDSKKQTEIIAKSLTSLRCLRDSVTTVFTTLEEGVTNAQDSKEKEKVFLTNVRKQLMTVTEKYRFVSFYAYSMLVFGCSLNLLFIIKSTYVQFYCSEMAALNNPIIAQFISRVSTRLSTVY